MKQRFSSLDIKVIAHELAESITTLRVVNIYDLSSKIFLFKLAKPDHRQQLLLDSGFRVHLTSFARTTAAAPSAFVTRLRKFLKTRRITRVSQVGTDRVLELQFSDGLYRLYLEFYASGNIVLTDKDLNILALQRVVTEGAPHEHVRIGSVYNLSERQNINGVPPLTFERLKDGLQRFLDRVAANEGQQGGPKKGKKKKDADMLRKALGSTVTEFPPILLEHALKEKNFDRSVLPDEVLKSDDLMNKLLDVLQYASQVVDEIVAANPSKGYIIAKQKAINDKPVDSAPTVEVAVPDTRTGLLYDDYHPFQPRQALDDPTQTVLVYTGFNAAVDEFYSSIEGQKLESRLQEKEEAARRKLEHARQDQEKRLGGLQAVQELNVRKAQAIEANIERVEEATSAINGLIAQGSDWGEIEKIIELEQKKKNPVAEYIKLPLKLNENTATLLLGEWEGTGEDEDEDGGDVTDEEPSDSEESGDEAKQINHKSDTPKQEKKPATDNRLAVDIDLALSGYSNAREYYDQRRNAAAKEEKTLLASSKALKSAQTKIEADLKRALKQEKQVLRPVRKQFWFEKFTYFVSSDGYLVLGAKDAHQGDILYKRYLKQGDDFVHADLNGAAMVIVKNKPGMMDAPIPPSTLSQAGNFCVATSSAWDSKAVMSAWWVGSEYVSKVAPTGDYLNPGSFHIKGEKNFLPPAQLLLGFAVLFQISEESKLRHTKHRIPNDGKHSDLNQSVESDVLSKPHENVETHELAENEPNDGDEDISDTASEAYEDDDATSTYQNPLQTGKASTYHENEDGATDSVEEAAKDHSDNDDADSIDDSVDPTVTALDKSVPDVEGHLGKEARVDQGSDEDDEGDEAAEEVADTQDDPSSSVSTTTPTTTLPNRPNTSSKPQIPQQLPRGKRGKVKKLRSRYADQDEEDRAMAMELLGSRAGQEKAAAEVSAQKEAADAAAAAKARRKEQHLRRELEIRKVEAAKAVSGEGGTGEHDEADAEDEDVSTAQLDLDALIGRPLAGDTILEALPICAPWAALSNYKYKVKLQPGSTKRGKIVREIQERWNRDAARKGVVDEKAEDTERMWPRERELIGAWRDAEVVGVVPVGKARVMLGGGGGGAGGGSGGGAKQKGGSRGGRGSKKR